MTRENEIASSPLHPRTKERRPRTIWEKLLTVFFFLILLLLILAAYRVFRPVLERVSADYYFPFLKVLEKGENLRAGALLAKEDSKKLAAMVIKLQKENQQLLAERDLVRGAFEENARLRTLLQLRPAGEFRAVFAQVLYRKEFASGEGFMLDKGENAGIALGNVVVSPVYDKIGKRFFLAVAGRVQGVSRHTAFVANVGSYQFRMNVGFAGGYSGVISPVPGVRPPLAGATFIPLEASIRKGEIVRTSSLTGNMPPGLPVGRVASSGGAPGIIRDQLYKEARIRPFVSPEDIRFAAVYVLKKRSAGETAPDGDGE